MHHTWRVHTSHPADTELGKMLPKSCLHVELLNQVGLFRSHLPYRPKIKLPQPGVNFFNILRATFMCADPKSAKNTFKPLVIFALLGYEVVKVLVKHLWHWPLGLMGSMSPTHWCKIQIHQCKKFDVISFTSKTAYKLASKYNKSYAQL